MTPSIVMDTNVLVAGLRSRRGASFRLLTLVGQGAPVIHLSTALLVEYEAVLMRDPEIVPALGPKGIDAVLD